MTILFAGQEDLSFQGIGSNISTVSTNPITINTTSSSGQYRLGYARCSINIQQNTANTQFWIRNASPFTSSSFWTSGRFWAQLAATFPGSGWSWMRWLDSNGVVRLLIKTSNAQGSILQIFKQDASSTQTQLGSNTLTGVSMTPSPPDKIDVFINYSASGSFILYVNGFVVFSYSGDVTTNSQTSLAYVDYGMVSATPTNNQTLNNHWSECIVATQDTRNMSLVTQLPLTAGNTAAWTTSSTTVSMLSGSVFITGNGSANTVYFVKFNITTQSGTLSSVQVSLNTNLTGNLNMAIYSDLNGAPNTRLGQGVAQTNPLAGQVVFPISGVTLQGSTSYWVAMLGSATWTWVSISGGAANGQCSQAIASFPATASAGGFGAISTQCQINTSQPNVSLSTVSQSGPDYSSTAAQVQQYQAANSIPTGVFSVISVVQHGQCTLASGGPQHIEFGVRTGGNDYFSPDLSPVIPWSLLTYNWDTNPNTSVAWLTTDLPAASTSFNLGYKATT